MIFRPIADNNNNTMTTDASSILTPQRMRTDEPTEGVGVMLPISGLVILIVGGSLILLVALSITSAIVTWITIKKKQRLRRIEPQLLKLETHNTF